MDNTRMKHKCCSKCRESKPATTEFFYAAKDNKDKLEAMCKVCRRLSSISNKVKKGQSYRRWEYIMSRCYTPSHWSYGGYGGRGVTVCEEWKSPDKFIEWYNKHNIEGWEIDKDIVGGR